MKKIFPSVVENTLIADNIFKLVLEDSFPHDEFKPGKFLHVKCSKGLDPLLRRPMSICDISDDERYLTVLYRKEGRGTTLLSEYQAGEKIDILAPLGNNFELPAEYENGENSTGDLQKQCLTKKVLLIGGGIGVPPLYYLGRKLKAAGHSIISILGFNAAKDVFYENEFKALGEVFITTVDGSYGMKGFVTDALAKIESLNDAEIEDCESSSDRTAPNRTSSRLRRTNDRSVLQVHEDHEDDENAEIEDCESSSDRTAPNRTSSRLRRTNDRSVLQVHEDHEDDENAEIVDWEPSYDVMYSCGPKSMLKALQSRISSNKLAYMSLEERMGCGVGACLACVCNYNEGFERDKNYSRVCTEGPVYKLHEISL
jgi:dihydroorotate dehydrogenase electron transfer subunit